MHRFSQCGCGTLLLLAAASFPLAGQTVASQSTAEAARWQQKAQASSITRDTWGIAHVHGASDADAVFGMIYAQCEDDFHRVEMNYLNSLGRLAEAEGEHALWSDLRQQLFIDPAQLKEQYARSPQWLRALMDAWADGINFYLARHPQVHPLVLTRFEPWMALSFTEGSIGGDIERVNLDQLRAFYDHTAPAPKAAPVAKVDRDALKEPSGSNGFAIAPANTRDHHALLLINPHTSFFFRSELQMTSAAGLNAYGAVTWGQFFVYQGFNDRVGWMHTSSGVDAVDTYSETVSGSGSYRYRYGNEERPVRSRTILLHYKVPSGLASRTFTTYATSHGPVIGERDGHWLTIQLMQRHVRALEQSYLRTKARNYAEYAKTLDLMANSSNNTVYADADGTIAYWHGNFIPRRDAHFDYTHTVDGANPATDWHGLLPMSEVPHLKNPASGYIFNVNDSPWNGAGASSLHKADFPAYVEMGLESARGLHAERVLNGHRDFTLPKLRDAAFDSYLPWFARTLPTLFAAYDALSADDPARSRLAPQIGALRKWDLRWGADSVPTSLAVFWGTELLRTNARPAREASVPSEEWMATRVPAAQLISALASASARLSAEFGSWQTPWSKINRFQRLTGDIVQPFSDSAPSIPVPFASALWGSLASFGAQPYPGTKRWYGTYGNSFVAMVEFGPRIHAIAITAGGESGDPKSPHFNDQAKRYASGDLREVYFYPEQLKGHTQTTYHPGLRSVPEVKANADSLRE
jgi:acyl-homoserine-lactone acylase